MRRTMPIYGAVIAALALCASLAYGQAPQQATYLPLVAKAELAATPTPVVPTLAIVARVEMPYGCLGGDSPLALADGRGGWLIECFRVDSREGSGAAPVYWVPGWAAAVPVGVQPTTQAAGAEPRAAPVTDCRGAWGYDPATERRYYFSWDCSASSRRPTLVVSEVH